MVVSVPPRSRVRQPSVIARSTARSIAAASCSSSSEWRSSSADGQDRADRVGDALAGDVRRRAVDRLVEAGAALAERRGRQHAQRAGQHRRLVGQDVAEHVLGDDDVEARGVGDEPHRAESTSMCSSAMSGLAAPTSTAICRHRREDSSTLALSTEVTLLAPAAGEAERQLRPRGGSRRRVLERVDRP